MVSVDLGCSKGIFIRTSAQQDTQAACGLCECTRILVAHTDKQTRQVFSALNWCVPDVGVVCACGSSATLQPQVSQSRDLQQHTTDASCQPRTKQAWVTVARFKFASHSLLRRLPSASPTAPLWCCPLRSCWRCCILHVRDRCFLVERCAVCLAP